MRRCALGLVLLVTACTAPEEALHFDTAASVEVTELEYSIQPTRVEPEPPTLEQLLAGELESEERIRRDPMWRITSNVAEWVDRQTQLGSCTAELPAFPAVSRDKTVLAIAIATAPVANEHAALVRFYRIADGAPLGSQWLLRPYESPLIESEPQTVRRRYCQRAAKLEQLVGGRFETMPVVGGWANRIREGLPEDARAWPLVIADGATRDVDMAVADIVVTTPAHEHERLQLRAKGREECETEDGQFSTVWATAEVSVLTRGPCGC